MIEGQETVFSFIDFRVPKSSYDQNNDDGSSIKVVFSPSGLYNQKKGVYELALSFTVCSEKKSENIIFKLTSIASFQFDPAVSLDDIPSYFYKNAIAIMFPYVRSFISTLTLQANIKLLKLNLMNLSSLEKPLRENTKAV